jgi:hypothetical protein
MTKRAVPKALLWAAVSTVAPVADVSARESMMMGCPVIV